MIHDVFLASELARRFTPASPRQHAMTKMCKLLVTSELGTCPCDKPTDCELAHEQQDRETVNHSPVQGNP